MTLHLAAPLVKSVGALGSAHLFAGCWDECAERFPSGEHTVMSAGGQGLTEWVKKVPPRASFPYDYILSAPSITKLACLVDLIRRDEM